jgi:AraC family ethanolamine operon transcriptional activator
LLQSLQSVAEMAVTSPALFGQAAAREVVHHELMSLIKECFTTSDSTPKEHLNMPFQRRYQIVKQAEAFIMAHLDRKIYIADLCENARVSERSLQYAFRDVLDLSPYKFMTLQRLNKARRALCQATSDQTTVNELALKYGFWHMGRFSRAYKALFGELPSKTIRRRGSSQQLRKCGH